MKSLAHVLVMRMLRCDAASGLIGEGEDEGEEEEEEVEGQMVWQWFSGKWRLAKLSGMPSTDK